MVSHLATLGKSTLLAFLPRCDIHLHEGIMEMVSHVCKNISKQGYMILGLQGEYFYLTIANARATIGLVVSLEISFI